MPYWRQLDKASFPLLKFCFSSIENKRKTLIISAMSCCSSLSFPQKVIDDIISYQKSDGGYIDPLETALSAFTAKMALNKNCYKSACNWLLENKAFAAWGNSIRDIDRIPVTGQILTLLPELASQSTLNWMNEEWENDLSSNAPLTYKGAFVLKAIRCTGGASTNLVKDTIKFLVEQQNVDGGFGPWKDHPIGSEPWSTGIALIGLSAWSHLVGHEVLVKALDWLGSNQLPNGLWPCHYIEEGSAYCYWGAVEALKALNKAGHPCAV